MQLFDFDNFEATVLINAEILEYLKDGQEPPTRREFLVHTKLLMAGNYLWYLTSSRYDKPNSQVPRVGSAILYRSSKH